MFGKKHSLGKMWIEDYRVFTLYLFSNKTVPWHTNEDLIMVPLIQQTIDIKLLWRMLPPNLFAGDYSYSHEEVCMLVLLIIEVGGANKMSVFLMLCRCGYIYPKE